MVSTPGFVGGEEPTATQWNGYFAVKSDVVSTSGRNLFHNPLFRVQQRGAGPFTSFGNYTADRWFMNGVLDTASVSLVTLSDSDRLSIGDDQAVYALRNTFTGNSGATAANWFRHSVEDVRRLSGQTVTVSFWAKSGSGTPKIGLNASQVFGTGGSPSSEAITLSTGVAITLSTSWTRYSTTMTFPSVAGMTLGTNGDDCTHFHTFFSAGSNNNAQAGNIGVQTGTVYLTGMQAEIGNAASALDKPDIATDWRNCQRCYQLIPFNYTFYGATGAWLWTTLPYVVQMRASPVLNTAGGSSSNGAAFQVNSLGTETAQISLQIAATGAASWGSTLFAVADI